MNKFLLFFVLISSHIGYSQISFGPKAGLSVSSVKAGDEIALDPKSKISYYVGGYGEYKFSEFAINIEVNYVDGGFKSEREIFDNFDDPYYKTAIKVSVSALNFYATGKYYFNEKSAVNFGGYYGRILSVKSKHNNTEGQQMELDFSESYAKSDYGLVIGFQYKIYKELFIDTKYVYGLQDINYNEDYASQFPDAEKNEGFALKTRLLNIGLGYKF